MNVTTNVLSSVGMCELVGMRTTVCSVKMEAEWSGQSEAVCEGFKAL